MNEEEAATTNDARSEWIKFGVLVAVFVIVILVVALSRPLIFGRIVPAVMGEGQSSAPAVTQPTEEEPASTETMEDAYPAPAEEESSESGTETSVEEPATTEEPSSEETTTTTEEETTDNTTEEETAADTPQTDNSFEYTIRQGDTLYGIARRYGTTAEEIVAANDSLSSLQDPIIPNTTIIIPRP